MPENIQILAVDIIIATTAEDKNTFILLLIKEFPSDLRNIITDKKASVKLSNLIQNKDEDLYIYYHGIKGLLKGIYGWDQIIHSSRDTIMLSPAK